jgi:hypothetical protein
MAADERADDDGRDNPAIAVDAFAAISFVD